MSQSVTNQNKNEPCFFLGVNIVGLWTLASKETERFLNVYMQTVVAPVVTTMLFYAIFAVAFGGFRPDVYGVSYLQFLAPGLIIMTMSQNAFANTSSSLMISKIQGSIVDLLMSPLSAGEIYAGYIIGAILRGLTVGTVTTLAMMFFVDIEIYSLASVFAFAFLGTMMLASMGVAGGIWADKFDHIAAVTNFIVTPMTFLSGTFYAIEQLPEIWQKIAHYNPFFHMIDGFRYGFIGHGEGFPVWEISFLVVINIILSSLCLWMLHRGYKIKS